MKRRFRTRQVRREPAFGLLKASPQGEGVHPSPVGTLIVNSMSPLSDSDKDCDG